MNKVSGREYEMWQEYFKLEANTPDRSDHYLMQLSQDVRSLFAKRGPKLEDCKIEFVWKDDKKPKPISEDQIKAAKSIWFGRIGYKGSK